MFLLFCCVAFFTFIARMRRIYYILICLLSLVLETKAQQNNIEKARALYNAALQFKAKKRIDMAIKILNNLIKDQPAFPDAYSTLGQYYYEQHQYKEGVRVFRKALNSCPNGNKAFARPLTLCLLGDYKADSALLVINTFGNTAHAEWVMLQQRALYIQEALRKRLKDEVYNMGPRINTISPEMFPSLSADTQILYFTRRHNNMDEDFYYALPDSCGGWFTAQNMGHPPNTADQESAQMMSADGHYLFFTRCENRSENGWGQGGCDLYMSYRSDSVWSVPESFGATINTPDFEGMPCLSADNRELYFCSNRPGGFGGYDIYVSRFEEGLWQAPRNLGPEINTAGNESSPFLHIDGETLYFSSDGLQGLGGKDLFMCRRINDTAWTAPVNMGYPINSTDDENSIYVSLDGKKIYFSSDRDSMAGNYDLYETHLPKELQPNPVSYFKGFVYDSLSKEKLTYATIVVTDAKTLKPLYRFVSNRGDASYMITLPLGNKYIFEIDRIGYHPWLDTISLKQQNFQRPLEKNISMLPLDYVAPITDTLILTIHFPLNSIKLSDSDKAMINRVLEPWTAEKGIVFFVNGYTDNTGTPMRNEELSTQRANLIAHEIKNKGFDEVNIRSRGYGEANPIKSNDTEDDRYINRRVEVVIRR